MLEASLKSKSTQVGSRYWALLWLGKHDGDINSPVWDLCSLVHLGSSLWVRIREAGGSVVSVPRVTPSLDEGRKPTGQWVELDHDAVQPSEQASDMDREQGHSQLRPYQSCLKLEHGGQAFLHLQ